MKPEGGQRSSQSIDRLAEPLGSASVSKALEVHLSQLCTRELRKRALLLDPTRVLEEAIAQLRWMQPPASEEDAYERWLVRRVAAAITRVRRIDRDRSEEESFPDDDYEIIVQVFFVPSGQGARSAHAFNLLPRTTRKATLELLLYQSPIEDCLKERIAPDEGTLARRARTGILTIMQIDERMLPPVSPESGLAPKEEEAE